MGWDGSGRNAVVAGRLFFFWKRGQNSRLVNEIKKRASVQQISVS